MKNFDPQSNDKLKFKSTKRLYWLNAISLNINKTLSSIGVRTRATEVQEARLYSGMNIQFLICVYECD